MTRFTAWRRRSWAGYAVVLAALVAIGAIYAGVSPATDQAQATGTQAQAADLAKGKELFNQNCASCHGLNAEGTKDAADNTIAPSLIGVGAAAVHFQITTGRMPAMTTAAQVPSKKVVAPFDDEANVTAVAEYIQSLGGGPGVPAVPEGGDVALGGKLFRTNCAQCHNFTGQGGALTEGKFAPDLMDTTPVQLYEAMLTGPQAMPVFNDTTLTPEDKAAIIAFIETTREEPNPGGAGLGRMGPVSEGLVGWVVGIGLLVFASIWITAKKPKKLKKS
ncbi:menaquinol-cytochrome c reductase cytochrome c1 subunit precursor [Actinocorallia herbida]|uniref:Cytochrome bc1 complex cytochrome c subunit n=1 Tax=Actinocorallia herbida TaxID=58109 RepID=A0A3N1CT22_9ACTN|nr:c-type cytochrome [Actinocorallia herbida]ROO83828.1 menaquinol-cytochrome c reductase cytochrome c1 subunit precursor [Actinocorallia herbida]